MQTFFLLPIDSIVTLYGAVLRFKKYRYVWCLDEGFV